MLLLHFCTSSARTNQRTTPYTPPKSAISSSTSSLRKSAEVNRLRILQKQYATSSRTNLQQNSTPPENPFPQFWTAFIAQRLQTALSGSPVPSTTSATTILVPTKSSAP